LREGKGRKAFFFEKKKQKTFISSLHQASRQDSQITWCWAEEMKVFWFFFSKKNILALPFDDRT
jgi:hypothetical protein